MRITDFRLRKLPENLRGVLFSFVPRNRMLGMDPATLMDVCDAYGRPDLAVGALKEMGLPVPTYEPHEPAKLKVIVTDESYRSLYERDVDDSYTERGTLSTEAARSLFRSLSE